MVATLMTSKVNVANLGTLFTFNFMTRKYDLNGVSDVVSYLSDKGWQVYGRWSLGGSSGRSSGGVSCTL